MPLLFKPPPHSHSSSATAAVENKMGLLFHTIKVPKFITLSFFLNIHYLLIGALTYLGLYKPPPEESPESAAGPNNYVLILDSSSPSLVAIPIHVVTAAIKSWVPVIEYEEIAGRREHSGDAAACSICLEGIEVRDEVRDLCNCGHLFHRACLDRWIDEGQVSCPLCRAMLLPPKVNLFRCSDANLVDSS